MSIVTVVTEGTTDTVVVRRICAEIGLEIAAVHGENGKHGLDKSLGGYNEAARRERWLILRDLDTDADCAPMLAKKLLPTPSQGMTFRIATRGIDRGCWPMQRRSHVSFRSLPAASPGIRIRFFARRRTW